MLVLIVPWNPSGTVSGDMGIFPGQLQVIWKWGEVMALTLWVCRDREFRSENPEIAFYRDYEEAKKHFTDVAWRKWSLRQPFLLIPARAGEELLKGAGVVLKPGEGPVKVEIEMRRV